MALTWSPASPEPARLLPAGTSGHLGEHQSRLGARPRGGDWLVEVLRQSGLRGKGGAAFPVWRKWTGVAENSDGRAIVLVNASEGEPLSAKDRTLLREQPHLVLDGAALAAESVGAREIAIYLSGAEPAVARALRERRRAGLREPAMTAVRTEHTYIAGESSAAARRVSGGPALPRFTPPHVSEHGVFGRPTLVQNVETLAHVALIARRGAAWFRELGAASAPGTTLMTLSGNVHRPGVYEVDLAQRLGDVVRMAGGAVTPPAGALLGGYFGTWLAADRIWEIPLASAPLGCGVLAVLPEDACGVVEAVRILDYLAGQTAGQCGPCVYGLRALSETARRLAASRASVADVERLWRWAGLVKGRGACNHPDGAAGQLETALTAFEAHLGDHLAGRRCPGLDSSGFPPPPRWRA